MKEEKRVLPLRNPYSLLAPIYFSKVTSMLCFWEDDEVGDWAEHVESTRNSGTVAMWKESANCSPYLHNFVVLCARLCARSLLLLNQRHKSYSSTVLFGLISSTTRSTVSQRVPIGSLFHEKLGPFL